MNTLIDLAEQHIRESESRLRHIDELMARARQAPTSASALSETAALLQQIQADRDRLAHELEELRRMPHTQASERASRGEGLRGVLEKVGLQLEQALTAIFASRG